MTLNNYRVLSSVIAVTTLLSACGGAPKPAPSEPAPAPAASSTPAAAAPNRPPVVKAGWTVTDMRTPESSYLDEGSGYLYVSQIDGQPGDKDGKGRISKLGLDGTVITADWVTGLNAPKGLRSYGGIIWVGGLDGVVGRDTS